MLTLIIDARAMLLSELVSPGDMTAADFEPVRAAFVNAVLDREGQLIDCALRDATRAPAAFCDADLDVAPVNVDEAEAAGRRLVQGLIQVATQRPLKSVNADFFGRMPDVSTPEAAHRLIAMELCGLWMPRAAAIVRAAERLALA